MPHVPAGKVLFAEIKDRVVVCREGDPVRYTVWISHTVASLEPLLIANNFEYGTAVLQMEGDALELAKALARPGLPVLYNDPKNVGHYRIWMIHSKEHERVATFFVAGSRKGTLEPEAASQDVLFLDDKKILCLMYRINEGAQLAYVMHGQNHDRVVEYTLDESHQFALGPKLNVD